MKDAERPPSSAPTRVKRYQVVPNKLHVHDVEPSPEPNDHALSILFRGDGQVCIFGRTNDRAALARCLAALARAVVEWPAMVERACGLDVS